ELEFLDILKHQKTNCDHHPMIYYRLSYLSQIKGDLQMSIHYINIAISYSELGFDLFEEKSPNALLNCLFYHLIEENDIEEYLKTHKNSLTEKYYQLQYEPDNDTKEFIKSFNKKFGTNLKCFDLNITVDSTYENNEIPIILRKHSNVYTTIKHVNHYMFLTILLTTSNVKNDLKIICSKFLDYEISQNILTDTVENKNIQSFISSMMKCQSMKIFNEEIIFYLNTDDYNQNCFDFWSVIADFDYNIDLTDTLKYFKELFGQSIEEHRKEIEDKHHSALKIIDDLLEQYETEV
ncbi:unnamed protein product, partial [Rotaria sp. Silwood2]